MNVDLWVAGLRILAALLIVSIVWPSLPQLRHWACGPGTDTRRTGK